MASMMAAIGIAAAVVCAAGTARMAATDEIIEEYGDYGMLAIAAVVAVSALALCAIAILYPAQAAGLQEMAGLPGWTRAVTAGYVAVALPLMAWAAWYGRRVPGHLLSCATGAGLLLAMTSTAALYTA